MNYIINFSIGLHAELASFQTEAECVRKKLLKVEEDLNRYKTKNCELNEELLKKLGILMCISYYV